MPRILTVPYHRDYLQPATVAFARRNHGELVDCTDDPFTYWRFIAARWDLGEPFAICEHDVVPTDSQWAALRDCVEPWCVFAYDRLGTITATLGFCAFDPDRLEKQISTELLSIPTLTQESREHLLAAGNRPHALATVPWNQVDGIIWTFLTSRGYAPHRHAELVEHVRAERKGEPR